MTIIYFSTVSFPNSGMATRNRILHLAKALINENCRVVVCVPFSDSGKIECFSIDGVEIVSLCSRKKWIATRWNFYINFPLRFLRFVRKINDKDKVIYSYQPSLWLMSCLFFIVKLCKVPLAREGGEYPYTMLNRAVLWKQWLEVDFIKKCDGMVTISKSLMEYYRGILVSKNVLHIPMTVDVNRFDKEQRSSPFDFDYITYTGDMNRDGGGVDILVKAFAVVARENASIHLVLIGKGSEELKSALLNFVDSNIAKRIHFLFEGISAEDMPRYIKNAKILAMLPLSTKQNEGGFSTKLGEYLASGVPTVISKVGNPIQYLTDGENVRFVPECDPFAAASVMLDILANYGDALKIASKGREYAIKHFHYGKFGRKLHKWFQRLLKDWE